MPAYSFKRNCKVYLVQGSSRWKIEVYPDLNFSQTFDEKAIKVKTLHDQNAMFDEAAVTKANPADFNFTVLLVKGDDFNIIGDWLTTKVGTDSVEALTTYDLYVDTGVDIFKLEKGIATRATFAIQKDALVTVSIQGTASKLTRFGVSGTTIPGTLQTMDVSLTPIIVRSMQIDLDGVVLPHIAGVSVELVNQIEWLEYETLHKSLYVTSASDTQYPEAFVVSEKVLSGTIQQYLTDNDNNKAQTWSTNSTLRIRIGDGSSYYLDINMPAVKWTNRLGVEEVFLQTYDFRMTHSPASVATVLNYNL
jgi:hypothetical protein